jgi:O-antigen ligase
VFGLYEALNGSRRLLGAAITILATAGVIVSGTRGAWVACTVVILFVVLPQLSARRRVVALVTMAAVALAVYQVPGVAELVADRTGNAVSSGGAGRTDIWTVGLAIFEKSPIVGVGYANFPVAFTTQMILDTGVGWEWLAFTGRGPHNIVVGTAAELGVVGLVLLIGFLGPLLVRRGWGPDAATVQASLIGLMTAALFLDMLSVSKNVWLVIALAAGLSYLARVERGRLGGTSTHAATRPAALPPPSPDDG